MYTADVENPSTPRSSRNPTVVFVALGVTLLVTAAYVGFMIWRQGVLLERREREYEVLSLARTVATDLQSEFLEGFAAASGAGGVSGAGSTPFSPKLRGEVERLRVLLEDDAECGAGIERVHVGLVALTGALTEVSGHGPRATDLSDRFGAAHAELRATMGALREVWGTARARLQRTTADLFRAARQTHLATMAALLGVVAGMVLGGVATRREALRRRAVEGELRRSADRLEQAERIAHVGYFDNDRRTNRVTGSAELLRMYGLETDEGLTADYIHSLIHPDDFGRIREVHKALLEDYGPFTLQYRAVVKGESRQFICNVVPERDASGEVVRTYGTVQDVTDLWRAQGALRASEARFRVLCEFAPVAIWRAGEDGRLEYRSPKWDEIAGDCPEIPGSWVECLHKEDREAATRRWGEALTKGTPFSYEGRLQGEGPERWVRVLGAPVEAQEGEGGGYVGTLEDVTERRNGEREALRRRAKFEAAIRATRQLLYDWDTVSHTLTWQGNSEEMVGVSHGAISDLIAWEARIHPEDLPRFGREIERVLKEREPFTLAYRVRHETRGYIDVMDRGFFVETPEGANHMIGMVIDQSDRKRMEQELLQAQKVESIGRLAGGVAHDFNNWLTAMLGYVALARDEVKDAAKVEEYLGRIEQAGQSAARLTGQLLAYARRQVIEPVVVNLNDVVRDAGSLLTRLLGEDVELRVLEAADLWAVRVDPGQFQQIVMNLALNARDAMPEGGRLMIETRNVVLDAEYAAQHPEVVPGDHVMIAVSDTGRGIKPEDLGHIFDPFYTTKGRGEGTGLGLATVHGLIKQHEGHIWVCSEVGRGTTFRVYMPREVKGLAVAVERDSPARPAMGTETVLVVEDEALVRSLAITVLRRQGYNVLEAGSVEEALGIAKAHAGPLDLLLTDVILPDKSGKELARLMVRLRPGLRVLYTSGYTDTVVVHHGILDDGVDFIQKPYTPSGLASRVRAALDAPQAANA